jgi:hypothetical protein
MIRHGHSGHPELFYAMAELLDVTGAVEHGIVSMKVKVNELGHSGNSILLGHDTEGKHLRGVLRGIRDRICTVSGGKYRHPSH